MSAVTMAQLTPEETPNGPCQNERVRGTRRAAPLRMDGRRGGWDAIENLWAAGELTDEAFEDDVIVADIGEGADGWDFPGSTCSVELR
ncbi:hypothetical protein [Streptomyces sp. NPDC127108]|uniref:hypothetical protein n=1 Tax=Streptomyces sp. NPDC127108 TaxID=3345361 RepID=UPI00363EF834